MDYPKVLVAIPYHSSKRYCLDRTFDATEALTYPNKEILLRVDPCEYGSENAVKMQREFFRKHAVDNGFDYLFFMGCDTIPPEGVIETLLSHGKDIVGGIYWGRHGASNGTPEGAVAWIHGMSQENQSKLYLTPNELLPVDGQGMDCVLISRAVLEKVSWLDWEQNDDDYPFYDKANALGYTNFVDTNVQCKHYFDSEGYAYRGTVARN